ncbi:Uncharacterized protein APZ42_017436 [Daphnia magna]|uniref:Uncharacterized protein n=1 Tax=Daphnia magna TaxID=35525 RepID=A0A162CK35_9CRUS|nr:Uncharacterized protein APZ42_017436 [Daphnia magna]
MDVVGPGWLRIVTSQRKNAALMDPYGWATPCFFHDSFSYLLVSTYGWGVYAFSFFF